MYSCTRHADGIGGSLRNCSEAAFGRREVGRSERHFQQLGRAVLDIFDGVVASPCRHPDCRRARIVRAGRRRGADRRRRPDSCGSHGHPAVMAPGASAMPFSAWQARRRRAPPASRCGSGTPSWTSRSGPCSAAQVWTTNTLGWNAAMRPVPCDLPACRGALRRSGRDRRPGPSGWRSMPARRCSSTRRC